MENGEAEVSQGFDVSAMAEALGKEIFASDTPATQEPSTEPTHEASPAQTTEPAPQAPPVTTRAVPASWPKEMHDYWGKTDPKVQEYWETREKQMMEGLNGYKAEADWAKNFRTALNPYTQTLKRLGVDEITAAKHLFNADHVLRYSPADQKRDYFMKLAKEYGVELNGATQAPVDPAVQALQRQVEAMNQSLTAREQAEQQARLDEAAKQVEAFAADTEKHPYFGELHDHITQLILGMRAAGKQPSLQDAYDQAVWANPITRAKEIARVQTEHEAKLKENARLEALPKKKAADLNVKGRDTKRTPTEPMGTMDDTLRKTYREIQERAH
jgi:hypothetical protein